MTSLISKTSTKGGDTRTIRLRREGSTFGFTVRHLIVVTPDDVDSKTNEVGLTEPMDTLYVKNVKRDSQAREVGLRKNDRILAVNDKPVTGCSYSEVMSLINHCGSNLKLLVIGREEDNSHSYPSQYKHSPNTSISIESTSIPENTRSKERMDQCKTTLPVTSAAPLSPLSSRLLPTSSPLSSSKRKSSPPRNTRRCREDNHWMRSTTTPTRTTSASPDKSVSINAGNYVANNRRRLKEDQEKKRYQRSYTTSSILDANTLEKKTNGYPCKLGTIVGDYGLAISHRGNIKLRAQDTPDSKMSSKSSTELNTPPQRPPCNMVTERLRKFESADSIGSPSASSSPFTPRYGCESVQARAAKYENLAERRRSSCDPTNGTINIYFRGDSPQPSVLLRKSADRKATPQRSCPHLSTSLNITPKTDSKDTKLTRRTSYLIATRQTQSDTEDFDLSPVETSIVTSTSELDRDYINTPPNQINKNNYNKSKEFFGEKDPNNEHSTVKKVLDEHIGALSMKISMVEGKRSTLRSWKQVWGVIKNNEFYFFREGEKSTQSIQIKNCIVEISLDYAKRKKYVFKLQTTEDNEYLFEVDDYKEMIQWINAINLHGNTGKDKLSEEKVPMISESSNSYSPPPSMLSVSEKMSMPSSMSTSALPVTSKSTIMKKTSKSSATLGYGLQNNYRQPKDSGNKENSWKGRVARKFKRYGSSNADSPSSNQMLTSAISMDATTSSSIIEGTGTFGIMLSCTPESQYYEARKNTIKNVPLIVQLCVEIVEEKGLLNQGIYRVPGNTGAVNALIDIINNAEKIDDYNMSTDARWSDVNVVSSLLKAFFRKLEEPLIGGDHYNAIIAANRIEDGEKRMLKIKKELLLLPDYNFETFHYLAKHLENIADKGDINKMDSRNLAIVFGPTLIRARDDNMVNMVRDMSDQCKIVETIIQQVEWFFSSWDEDYHVPVDEASAAIIPLSGMNEELLNKAKHLEGGKSDTKDMFSSMLHSAHKKIRGKDRSRDSIETEVPDADPDCSIMDASKELEKHKPIISKPIAITTTTLKTKETSIVGSGSTSSLVESLSTNSTIEMTPSPSLACNVHKKTPCLHIEENSPKITRYPAITSTIQSAVESLAQFDAPKTIHHRRYSIAELAELDSSYQCNNSKKSPEKKYSKAKTFDSSDGSMNINEYSEAILSQTNRLYQTSIPVSSGEQVSDDDLGEPIIHPKSSSDSEPKEMCRRHTLSGQAGDIALSFSPSQRPFDPSLRPH